MKDYDGGQGLQLLSHEIDNNYELNKIFVLNTNWAFGCVMRKLQETPTSDILLVLDDDEIYRHIAHTVVQNENGNIIMQYDSQVTTRFYEHLIALFFMRKLQEKYSIQTDHDLIDEEKYFTERSIDDYLEHESSLVTREDVIKAIDELNMEDTRLHIVMGIASTMVRNELSYYLQDKDNQSFITMIYSKAPFSINNGCYEMYINQRKAADTYPKSSAKRKSTKEQEKR